MVDVVTRKLHLSCFVDFVGEAGTLHSCVKMVLIKMWQDCNWRVCLVWGQEWWPTKTPLHRHRRRGRADSVRLMRPQEDRILYHDEKRGREANGRHRPPARFCLPACLRGRQTAAREKLWSGIGSQGFTVAGCVDASLVKSFWILSIVFDRCMALPSSFSSRSYTDQQRWRISGSLRLDFSTTNASLEEQTCRLDIGKVRTHHLLHVFVWDGLVSTKGAKIHWYGEVYAVQSAANKSWSAIGCLSRSYSTTKDTVKWIFILTSYW